MMSVPELPAFDSGKRPPKPHLKITEQLALLESRGMKVPDPNHAADCLRRIGYYRLSGYWKPFQADPGGESEQLAPGTSFSDVLALYVFDKRLRLILLDALERIEIALRAEISHHMGAKDPLAHRRENLLRPNNTTARADTRAKWLARRDYEEKISGELFAKHHIKHYGGELPIWVSTELWSFGALSKFYAMMRGADQRAVAARFGVENERLMGNWMRGMAFVRNTVAHHGRLWNRGSIGRLPPLQMGKVPAGFNPPTLPGDMSYDRLYAVLCVIVFLVRQILPNSRWPGRLREMLLMKFPQTSARNLSEMGFPQKWESSAFWRE